LAYVVKKDVSKKFQKQKIQRDERVKEKFRERINIFFMKKKEKILYLQKKFRK
jgi:hypothetical protein